MNRLKRIVTENRWGGQCLVSLYISVLSGIVLALQYNPTTPFYATTTIELIVPFGSFWRALHYYASQAFFLLLTGHLVAVFWRDDYRTGRGSWIRLTASFPIALLLLFTGYILRGDATGEAAGSIAEHIMLSLPVLGSIGNDLLFDIQSSGVLKVYAQHLIGLMALGAFCLWPHLRKYGSIRFSAHLLLCTVLLGLSMTWPAPMEPDHVGLTHIAGPWFFLGLQELLRFLPPFWAGIVIPALPLTALFFLPDHGRKRTASMSFMAVWLICYCLITLFSLQRF